MAELSGFPDAAVLDGAELLPALQGGAGVKVTSAAIAGLARGSGGNRIAILGNSLGATIAPFDFGDAVWTAATAKALGAYVRPKCHDLRGGYAALRYKVTTAGTTAAGFSEPAWPKVAGATVSDGSVVYTAEAATGGASWAAGWWTLTQMLSGQRFDEVFLMARGGAQAAEVLAYLDRALAAEPDIVCLANCLDNNVYPGSAPTLAQIEAAWVLFKAACDKVRAAGKRLWLQTLVPNGATDNAAVWPTVSYARGNGTEAWHYFNRRTKEYARSHHDVELFAVSAAWINPDPARPVHPDNAATFAVPSGTAVEYTDGIHLRNAAAWKVAQIYAARINQTPIADRFGAALDANQRMPNPLNHGTTGTHGANVTPSSGVVPVSMALDAGVLSGTGTGAASRIARTDGAGHWLQCAYACSGGSADRVVYNPAANIVLSPNAVGDVVQAFAEIAVMANPSLFKSATLELRFIGGVPQWSYGPQATSQDQDLGQFITNDTVLTLKSLPVAIPAGTSAMNLYAKANGRGAASFTVRFGRMALGRVTAATLA